MIQQVIVMLLQREFQGSLHAVAHHQPLIRSPALLLRQRCMAGWRRLLLLLLLYPQAARGPGCQRLPHRILHAVHQNERGRLRAGRALQELTHLLQPVLQ